MKLDLHLLQNAFKLLKAEVCLDIYIVTRKILTANRPWLSDPHLNYTDLNLGLDDQGLYRIVGVTSKVNRLLTQGLDKKKIEKLNFDDATEVESKTVRMIHMTIDLFQFVVQSPIVF